MADYININNASKNGKLGISRKAFVQIADEATSRVVGAQIVKTDGLKVAKPTKVTFLSNGKVKIEVAISIKRTAKPNEVCLRIQEEISHDLAIYTESVPFEIVVSIMDIR